jgi:6-phosphogluconolactonase
MPAEQLTLVLHDISAVPFEKVAHAAEDMEFGSSRNYTRWANRWEDSTTTVGVRDAHARQFDQGLGWMHKLKVLKDVIVDTRERLTADFTGRFAQASAGAIAARGRVTVAIAGRSVAQVFLPPLETAAIEWSGADVFWCDERAVPPNDPESNYREAMTLLFSRLPASAATLHRMPADAPDLDEAARVYERAMRQSLGDRPQLDVVLIGAGPDGHICSLFPGHPALEERERWVVAIHDSPKPPPKRMTLTMPVLEAAGTLILGVFGRDKAEIVREIVESPDSPLPAARAVRGNPNSVCLLDHDAARLLTRR